MIKHYRLDGRRVVECSLEEWAVWFEKANIDGRRVAADTVAGYDVSTVFLGLDHSIRDDRRDIFETAVFDSGGDVDVMQRYATWQDAEDGHNAIVAALREFEADAHEITLSTLAHVRASLRRGQ